MSPAQKHLFYTELAKLLAAGFGIREAAAIMLEGKLPQAQARVLEQMNSGLDEGQTIAASFGGDTSSISDLERGIIRAGERGGRLAIAFDHLADYFGLVAASRREMLKALIYPLVLLHMGIFVGIVPKAVMGGRASVGDILLELLLTLLIVYSIGLLIVAGAVALLKVAPEKPVVDRFLNSIPWVGKARRSMAMSRFTKVYHIGLLAGLSMEETLETSMKASQSGVLREHGTALMVRVKAGEKLGPGLINLEGFPKVFSRSYATGEEAGTLDKDLAKWAIYFQEEATQSIRTLSVVLPKILYGLVLIFVVWKILGFYNGYLDLLNEIGE
jgi:type IV pilus assembly protein PilC